MMDVVEMIDTRKKIRLTSSISMDFGPEPFVAKRRD
jgi:hypothetical protein